VSPLRGEKPQNRPLSKLNTGMLALRAMLPVMTNIQIHVNRLFYLLFTCLHRFVKNKPGMSENKLNYINNLYG